MGPMEEALPGASLAQELGYQVTKTGRASRHTGRPGKARGKLDEIDLCLHQKEMSRCPHCAYAGRARRLTVRHRAASEERAGRGIGRLERGLGGGASREF